MAKFFGKIGFGEAIEVTPGVWEIQIVERSYYGDVVRNVRKLQPGESVNNDITVDMTVSIVSDAYADEHFFAINYIEWAGALWTVSNVEVQSPRLLLRLGGVYNGPKA
jgi:hypothetical protein